MCPFLNKFALLAVFLASRSTKLDFIFDIVCFKLICIELNIILFVTYVQAVYVAFYRHHRIALIIMNGH